MKTIPVIENVLKLNDELASLNRAALRGAGLFTVNLIGAPGSGKTALLESTCRALPHLRIGILCGDLATQRDADRLARLSPHVVQINTGKGCHLEANHIHQALAQLDLTSLDLLFIENVGNLICPVGFDLGQDAKVGVFSVTGGDDKAAKHPYIVTEANLLLLTKTDLLPYVPFDLPLFRSDVQRLAPRSTLLELSPLTGAGMDVWTRWLTSHLPSRTRPSEIGTQRVPETSPTRTA